MINSKADNKSFYITIFILVLPMALQNLINVGVSSADVIMLGKVSETVLSASSLANQIQFIMTLIFFGLTSGAAVLTAQYWGKGDTRTIEKVLGIALRFSLVVSVIFTVVIWFFPSQAMGIFTSDKAIISEGVKFLKIISFSYIFTSITMIYLNIMRSVERVVISTIVYSISFFVNVILNAILIFGMFGFPKLGIRGSAIATLTARILELIIVIIYAKKYNDVIKFKFSDLLVKDKVLFKDFLTYSIPVTINELLWGVGTSMNAAVIGHLGKSVIAANSVAQVTRQLATVITFGIANATAIIIGKAIGENNYEDAKNYSKRFIKLSLFAGLFGAIIILIIRPLAMRGLNLSETAQGYLSMMMYVMSYFVIAQALNTTFIVGIFRAGGDTVVGAILDVSTMWGCSILFGILAAFVFKWSVPIVYVILMSDEIMKIPFTFWRYTSMRWLKNVTR